MTPMMNVPSGQNIQLTDVRGVKTDTDNLLIINRSLIAGPPMCETETGARFFSFSEHQEFLSFVCSFTLLCLCGGHFCPWPAPTCSPCCSVGDGGGGAVGSGVLTCSEFSLSRRSAGICCHAVRHQVQLGRPATEQTPEDTDLILDQVLKRPLHCRSGICYNET